VSSSPSEGGSPVAHEPEAPRGIELTVPELGPPGEAAVTSWSKSPGDRVELDEPICRIRVEEVEMEVCSSAAGRISGIFAHAGQTVIGGDTLAVVEAEGAEPEAFAPEPDADMAASPAPEPDPVLEDEPAGEESLPVEHLASAEESLELEPSAEEPLDEEPSAEEPLDTEPSAEEPLDTEPSAEEPLEEPLDTEPSTKEPLEEPLDTEPSTEEPLEEPSTEEPLDAEPPAKEPAPTDLPGFGQDVDWSRLDWSQWHSPIVKLLAEEYGVDLSQVEGTGIDGRIRKRDVLAHIESADGD
jgi:pyruvate dehydrogenase E2 component (dihydrolipoamide acetyltransferase)